MPPRRSPLALGALLALAAACGDPATAPSPAAASPAAVPLLVAAARPAFSVIGADGYWEGFDFLFGATGLPLAGGWPEHPPTPWKPTDFDVAMHSRDPGTWYTPEPLRGMHGTACQPFQNPEPANDVRPGDTGSHLVATWDDMNYRCRNHMMTALRSSGYGVIYVTPNAMVDFSAGEASVKFALSTLRTSSRDWVDLWVTPWDDNLALPIDGLLGVTTDLQGPPRQAVHVRMAADPKTRTRFELYVVNNFGEVKLGVSSSAGYESILKPVSTRRDTFELRISATRVRFGMKKLASPDGPAGSMTWFDVPVRLPFTRGVLQFGHHSMNPAVDGGAGGTWHWDDFTIAPAVPFTIVTPARGADGTRRRYVDAATAGTPIVFERPAPADASLRFAAYGVGLQVSVDDGATWIPARRQPAAFDRVDRFRSYWTPIPAGTASVRFRAQPAAQTWMVRDATIWSRQP